MEINDRDYEELRHLEEGLWRSDVRFSLRKMEAILAPDFFEYGRSGRTYRRAECLAAPFHEIDAVIPLIDFQVRLLSPDVAQVTDRSAVRYEGEVLHALRSSIW